MEFVPGIGATLKSTSLEAALFEAGQLLELAEEASATPNTVNFTDISHNNNSKVMTMQCVLPVTVSMVAGSPTFLPTNHVNPPFVKGTGLEKETLCGAILELAQKLQAAEQAVTANAPDRVNIIYNTNTLTATITAQCISVRSVSPTGAILTTISTYLG